MEINFEFQKERKIGDFLQSFIDLLKVVLKHFVRTVFSLSIIPLSLVTVVYYFLSTKITFSTGSDFFDDLNVLGLAALLLLTFLLLLFYVYAICIEYFILLKDQNNIDFTADDVFLALKENLAKYVNFFFVSLVVILVIAIPAALIMALTLFIPIVGSFAIGIVFSVIGLWFFCSFLFYREGYFSLIDTFTQSFSVIRKKLLQYGIATYIVSFVFQVVMMMLTLIPSLIIGLISYNFIEFDYDFFDDSWGKLLLTIGGLLITLFTLVLYMGGVLANGIIYETAKDLKYGDRVYKLIDQLGGGDDA